MTPCATIRRCAGSSAVRRPTVARPRRARWAASRRGGLRRPRNFCSCRLSGHLIDLVHGRRPPRGIVLDIDSSVSPTHGEQEQSVWNGHYECTCYHPLFVFNQFGDLERCSLRPGNVRSADGWESINRPVIVRRRGSTNAWRPSGSNTRSGCPPTRSFRTGSAICSSARSDDRRTMCGGTTPISSIRRQVGRSHAG